MALHIRTATAKGFDPFPIDMLRYDAAWPATEEDAHEITRSIQQPVTRREINLKCISEGVKSQAWTSARWLSFGWTIEERK